MGSVTEVCSKAWEQLKARIDPAVSQQETVFKQKCAENAFESDSLLTLEREKGTREQCFLELKDGKPVPVVDEASVTCLELLAIVKKWVALKAGKPVEEKKPEPPVEAKPAEEKKPEPPVEAKPVEEKKPEPPVEAKPAEEKKPEPRVEPVEKHPAESEPPAGAKKPEEAPPAAPVEAPKDTPKDPGIVASCQQFVTRNDSEGKDQKIDPAILQTVCEEIATARCPVAFTDSEESGTVCLDRNKSEILTTAKTRTVAKGFEGATEPVGPDVPVVVDTPPDSRPFKRPPIYAHLGFGVSPTDRGIAVDGHDPALAHEAGIYARAAAGVLLGDEDVGHGWSYRNNVGAAFQYMNFTTEADGDYTADYSLWGLGVVGAAEFVWKSTYVNVVIAPEMALLFGAWETDGLIATDTTGKDYRTRGARFVVDWQFLGLNLGAEFPAAEKTLKCIPYVKVSWRGHLFLNGATSASNAPEGREGVVRPDSPIGDGFAFETGVRF